MTQKISATLVVALLGTARLLAAEPPNWDEVIRQRAEAFVDKSLFFGLAVGLVDGDKVHEVCVGHRSIGGPAPDEKTLFEIGSVTKTFTGILLADAVKRGEVKLDQPLAELLGPDVKVPKFEGHPIRLVDLATQTSGLPRLPSNMGILINPLNPYADYRVEDLNKFLEGYKLSRTPGKEYEYSNLGMGLLGHALAKRAGMTYEELLKQRICGPLGLSDTVITLSSDQDSRMASGISFYGLPAMRWDCGALPGCGAIRSSLHDMLIYLRANLSPDTTPLGKAIALSHEPRFTIHERNGKSPDKTEIGLAWMVIVEDDNTVILHDGMTGGYSAFIAFVPGKHRGLVVLANKASFQLGSFCNGLLKDMLNDKQPGKNSPAETSRKANDD